MNYNSENTYTIQHNKSLKIFMLIAVLFFAVVFYINFATCFLGYELGAGISVGTVVFFGVTLLLYILMFLRIVVWRIRIVGDDIFYRNCFGITKQYGFSQLDKVCLKNPNIVVYCKNCKIFVMNSALEESSRFWHDAEAHNVATEIEKKVFL